VTGSTIFILEAHATARREALHAEADRIRAGNRAAAARTPGLLRRQIGALLVSAGERLHGQGQTRVAEGAC